MLPMTNQQEAYKAELIEEYLIDLQVRLRIDEPNELLMFGTFWDVRDRDQLMVVAYLLGRADQRYRG